MEVLRPGGLELTRYGLSQLRIPAGGRLLDIGCGKGEAALLAQTEFGLTVTAVDVDKDAVESAAARGLDARVMDASALEFPSRSFDIVSCVMRIPCISAVFRSILFKPFSILFPLIPASIST